MRIHRLHLWNVAGIRERRIEFDPGITVIEGPNESGKSTLLEALQLLLETPDNSHRREVQRLRPLLWPAEGPEVEAELSFGPWRATYRKRWLVQPRTSLTLAHPDGRVERLGGGEAHERMRQLFQEHVDTGLWNALRVMQGGGRQQVQPGTIPSLLSFLDRLSGENRPDNAASLLDRVREARSTYWTERDRPRGPYREALQAYDEARRGFRAVEEARRDTDRLAQDLLRATDDLHRRREQLVAAQLRQQTVAQQTARVAEAREALHQAEEAQGRARREHDVARQAWAARVGLLDAVRQADERCRTYERDLRAQADRVEVLERRRSDAEEAYEAARRATAEAEQHLAEADADRRVLEARREIAALERRIGRIRALEAQAAALKQTIDRGAAWPGLLRQAEELHQVVTTSAARLAAQSPRVQLQAVAPLEVEVGSERVVLKPDEERTWPVTGRLTVRYGDLRLAVFSGADATQEARAYEEARERLAATLRQAGADSLAALRDQAAAVVAAQRDWENVRSELEHLLGEDTLAELEARRDVLVDRLAKLEAGRAPDRPRSETEAAAEAAFKAAEERLRQARERQEGAKELVEAIEAELARAVPEQAVAAGRLDEAERQRRKLVEQLESERSRRSDAELEAAVASAAAALREADRHVDVARAALEALAPDAVELEERNVRELVGALEREVHALENDIAKMQGNLESLGGLGLDEQLAAARDRMERAEATLRRVEREAQAVRLLAELLARERERAMALYRQPYQQSLDRYGRAVFGPDFRVELDDNLAITARVDAGTPLDFDLLSTGAQEQLAVLARAACAQLAGRHGEGVPLILDDAFGYSDPERLERLGAVLHDVGRSTQVIVLTCLPDRYRWVSGARVVRVDREPGTRDERVAADGGTSRRGAPDAGREPLVEVDGDGVQDGPEAVLQCLREAGRPLSKGEILERTGLPETAWSRTIRRLLDAGEVVQIGTRRAARYQRPA